MQLANTTNTLKLANRMSHIAPFEVMEIYAEARALEAAGHDIIHMHVGEPDFPTPQPIIDAATRALQSEPMHYTQANGTPSLRKAIAKFYADKYRVKIDPARIVVTTGSSAALVLAFGLLLNEGDGVLMADPGYPCNRHFVRTMGGVPQSIAVGADTAYQLTAQHVDWHWTNETVATLVASPSNPTGTIVANAELQKILNAARARGGTLIVDEIYQGLTYGVEPSTALALQGAEDLFVINSFSKYFQMTGWRLGWLVVPEGYIRAAETLAQNLYISPPSIAQIAAHAAFLPETMAVAEARRAAFHARRDFLIPKLCALGWRIPVIPEGAFYVYADVSEHTNDSFAFCYDVLRRAHVAITPGKDFGANAPEKHVRIAYTQDIPRLEEATARLAQLARVIS
jgi:aspartate/methionine/tyrosine aminotransferase